MISRWWARWSAISHPTTRETILASPSDHGADPARRAPFALLPHTRPMKLSVSLVLLCTALAWGQNPTAAPKLERSTDRIVVAADGSGDFQTIQAAIDFAEAHRERPVVVFIRKGRYEEL